MLLKNRLLQRKAARQPGQFYIVTIADGVYTIADFTGTEAEYTAYKAAHSITEEQILCYTRV